MNKYAHKYCINIILFKQLFMQYIGQLLKRISYAYERIDNVNDNNSYSLRGVKQRQFVLTRSKLYY